MIKNSVSGFLKVLKFCEIFKTTRAISVYSLRKTNMRSYGLVSNLGINWKKISQHNVKLKNYLYLKSTLFCKSTVIIMQLSWITFSQLKLDFIILRIPAVFSDNKKCDSLYSSYAWTLYISEAWSYTVFVIYNEK